MVRVEVIIDVSVHRDLAYRNWEARGRPLWDDHHDWFTVEKEMLTFPRRIREQLIRRYAAKLWHDRGRPPGEDLSIWCEAESTLDRLNPVFQTAGSDGNSNGQSEGVGTILLMSTE